MKRKVLCNTDKKCIEEYYPVLSSRYFFFFPSRWLKFCIFNDFRTENKKRAFPVVRKNRTKGKKWKKNYQLLNEFLNRTSNASSIIFMPVMLLLLWRLNQRWLIRILNSKCCLIERMWEDGNNGDGRSKRYDNGTWIRMRIRTTWSCTGNL